MAHSTTLIDSADDVNANDMQVALIENRGRISRELTDRGLGHIRKLLRAERSAGLAFRRTTSDTSPATLGDRIPVLQALEQAQRATDEAAVAADEQAIVAAAVHLAEQLIEADVDHFAMVEGMARLLIPAAFTTFCEAIGACPVHLCDVEICADDADELAGDCAASQQARAGE